MLARARAPRAQASRGSACYAGAPTHRSQRWRPPGRRGSMAPALQNAGAAGAWLPHSKTRALREHGSRTPKRGRRARLIGSSPGVGAADTHERIIPAREWERVTARSAPQ